MKMLILASSTQGPYADKVDQVAQHAAGTLVTWGYRPKWVSKLLFYEIVGNGVPVGTEVLLCKMTPGTISRPVVPLRWARILRLKPYVCRLCLVEEQGFVRFDLELINKDLPGQFYLGKASDTLVFEVDIDEESLNVGIET